MGCVFLTWLQLPTELTVEDTAAVAKRRLVRSACVTFRSDRVVGVRLDGGSFLLFVNPIMSRTPKLGECKESG